MLKVRRIVFFRRSGTWLLRLICARQAPRLELCDLEHDRLGKAQHDRLSGGYTIGYAVHSHGYFMCTRVHQDVK